MQDSPRVIPAKSRGEEKCAITKSVKAIVQIILPVALRKGESGGCAWKWAAAAEPAAMQQRVKLSSEEGREVPRKGNTPKREVLPDPVYGSVVVAKLINSIMLDGKKGVAQNIVYSAFDRIKETTGEEPLEVFEKAMNNIMPVLEVKARRIGGANYQVPIEVRPERRQTLGLRWLTQNTRKRGEKTMAERLAKELVDASNNTGASVKKKEDTHKMAEANKAFAHFRW